MGEKNTLKREEDKTIVASIKKIKLIEATEIIQEGERDRKKTQCNIQNTRNTGHFYPKTWNSTNRGVPEEKQIRDDEQHGSKIRWWRLGLEGGLYLNTPDGVKC